MPTTEPMPGPSHPTSSVGVSRGRVPNSRMGDRLDNSLVHTIPRRVRTRVFCCAHQKARLGRLVHCIPSKVTGGIGRAASEGSKPQRWKQMDGKVAATKMETDGRESRRKGFPKSSYVLRARHTLYISSLVVFLLFSILASLSTCTSLGHGQFVPFVKSLCEPEKKDPIQLFLPFPSHRMASHGEIPRRIKTNGVCDQPNGSIFSSNAYDRLVQKKPRSRSTPSSTSPEMFPIKINPNKHTPGRHAVCICFPP